MSRFQQLVAAQKRAEHFAGPYCPCPADWSDWAAVVPLSRYAFLENILLMRDPEWRKGSVEYIEWLDCLAGAINRYIDRTRVRQDHSFRAVLRWFQQESIADWKIANGEGVRSEDIGD